MSDDKAHRAEVYAWLDSISGSIEGAIGAVAVPVDTAKRLFSEIRYLLSRVKFLESELAAAKAEIAQLRKSQPEENIDDEDSGN